MQRRFIRVEVGEMAGNLHRFGIGHGGSRFVPRLCVEIADLGKAEEDVALPLGVPGILLDKSRPRPSPGQALNAFGGETIVKLARPRSSVLMSTCLPV
jgi:hypothetical protein